MGRGRNAVNRLAERSLIRLARTVDAPSHELVDALSKLTRSPAVVRDPKPPLLELGAHSAQPQIISFLGDKGSVRIGKWCSIERSAQIFVGGEHMTDRVTMYPLRLEFQMADALADGFPSSKGPVVIGNDVWLGWESLVLSGVTIGDGAVVAARAVVTRDVEPFSVVAGVPARHVRWRFEESQREALQRIAWWDWPDEQVRAHVHELLSPNVQAFIDAHDPGRPAGG